MSEYAAAFRRCLIELDTDGIRDLWWRVSPHLPQPKDSAEALVALHYSRTAAASVPERSRLYSHAWLVERGFASALPDPLKPKAERLYPRTVEAVGIAVKSVSEAGQERARYIERAMSDAVMECYVDGEWEPEKIKRRMAAARAKAEAQ